MTKMLRSLNLFAFAFRQVKSENLMKKSWLSVSFFFFFAVRAIFAQPDTLRIATYNLLFFPEKLANERIPEYRRVMRAMDPDILIVQELSSGAGLQMFLKDVLNAGQPDTYRAAPYNDYDFNDNGLFYKHDKVIFTKANHIQTDLRDISEYILYAGNVRFLLYSLHLKAGYYETNIARRLKECTTLRKRLNALPANTYFMTAGDYNMYSSSEPGFIKLTEKEQGNNGDLHDPINQLGPWHESRPFAAIHTQSTRREAFGYGSTGGLDDRFDFILVSANVLTDDGVKILPDTYTAFGNDGNHLNNSINRMPNQAVPDSIAQSLYLASDHLPVFADFVFGTTVSVAEENNAPPAAFGLMQNYPNPFNSETEIAFSLPAPAVVHLSIFDLAGRLIKQFSAEYTVPGNYTYIWNGKNDAGANPASGIYILTLQTGRCRQSRKMLLVR